VESGHRQLECVCSSLRAGPPCTLWAMSLFDASEVRPPQACSRCAVLVQATSLFCPSCGQSTVHPRPAEPIATPAVAQAPESPAPEPEPATTTGWLRRSLSLGKKPVVAPENPVPADDETQQMSLFEIEQAEAVALEKTQRRAQPGIRFVLKFDDGASVTVSDQDGIMGVKPVVDSDPMFRVCLDDPTDTVAPEHLQFGVDAGVFWVQDLKTVNGTVVEEPGSPLMQCIPYEKYFVVRGSRVGLGSLFFTLA